MSVLLATRSAAVMAALSFENALFVISDCIAEARCCEDTGQKQQARLLYGLAERYALQSGFVELMRLVWTYQEGHDRTTSE